MAKVIETVDLTRRFGELTAVDRLNIAVEHGEIFGLIGPNGAGKTTTISMLCTILRPTSGKARIGGYDITRQANQVRRLIGIVFQDPSVDDRLTGRENLFMHANLYGVPPSDQKGRIDKVLKLVELEDRADDILRTYSSGMRRRLEIARGLIHYPKVLFLDEPTIGLDPQTRSHMWTYIKELKETHDITVVLTTHYMEEADRLSDRVAIVDYGKVVALGTPGQLKKALQGDVITVTTKDAEKLCPVLYEKLKLERLRMVDGRLELTVQDGEMMLPKVVETAAENRMHVEAVVLHQPSLEDVFLHYTGRAIREEGSNELRGEAARRRRTFR